MSPLQLKEWAVDSATQTLRTRRARQVIGGLVQFSDWQLLAAEIETVRFLPTFAARSTVNGTNGQIRLALQDLELRAQTGRLLNLNNLDAPPREAFIRHLSQLTELTVELEHTSEEVVQSKIQMLSVNSFKGDPT